MSCFYTLLGYRRRQGLGYRLLLGPMCDRDTRQLNPGGVAILFGWAHQQTNIFKKGEFRVDPFSTSYPVYAELGLSFQHIEMRSGFLQSVFFLFVVFDGDQHPEDRPVGLTTCFPLLQLSRAMIAVHRMFWAGALEIVI